MVIKYTYRTPWGLIKYHYIILDGTNCTHIPDKVFKGMVRWQVVVENE